jgi:uncharacterized membrane protein
MSRSKSKMINFWYILLLVAVTLFVPLAILMGTLGTGEFIAGIIGALLSFLLLGGYVFYTLILGAKNS